MTSGVVEKVGPGVTSGRGDQVCGMVGFPLAAGGMGSPWWPRGRSWSNSTG